MGQVLYRKNRPRKLAEVVGQEHITHTLANALKKGSIGHAYLFTGPRGTGKTSVARILAHEINGLPYTDDAAHLDIIEIDAASNRRIDEIRDLRDRVNIAPTSAKYKVYIIDEVHMLTREAFNALLKTLEEPPSHVVFILATTESHKLPETIISRTQRFTFKPVPPDKVVAHLRSIADREKINIDDAALALIARHGEGSFRDSISLLDQAGGYAGKIGIEQIQIMLGIPPVEATTRLVSNLVNRDAHALIRQLAELHEQGHSAAQIAKQLSAAWRDRLLDRLAGSMGDFALLQKLLDVPSARDPRAYLEIVLLEYIFSVPGHETRNTRHENTPKAEASIQTGKPEPGSFKTKVKSESESTAVHARPAAAVAAPAAQTTVLDKTIWPKVLAELKKKHNTLYGVVRMAQPKFTSDTLELGFTFAFHRKRLSEPKNQAIVADTVEQLTGQRLSLACVEVTATATPKPNAAGKVDNSITAVTPTADIASISNIFGGGELLES